MTTSEKLLTAIAIRLAGLVVVGFIAQTMVADRPQREIAWVTNPAVVHMQAIPAAKQAADEMLLHD